MSEHYRQNYSEDEIKVFLEKAKGCIRKDRFIVSTNENRQENIDFINEYNLTSQRQKEILLRLEVKDFCHSLQNTNVGYEHEVLYVFCPQVLLYDIDDLEEMIDIYIKFNLLERQNGNRTIIISFHKRNRPINYLFR